MRVSEARDLLRAELYRARGVRASSRVLRLQSFGCKYWAASGLGPRKESQGSRASGMDGLRQEARRRTPEAHQMLTTDFLNGCGILDKSLKINGAPRAIRTPDLQIRSHLVASVRSIAYPVCTALGVRRGGALHLAAAGRRLKDQALILGGGSALSRLHDLLISGAATRYADLAPADSITTGRKQGAEYTLADATGSPRQPGGPSLAAA